MPEFHPFDGQSEWPSQPVSPLPFNFESFNGAPNDGSQQYTALRRQTTTDSMTSYLPFIHNEFPPFEPNDMMLTQAPTPAYNQQFIPQQMFPPPELSQQQSFPGQPPFMPQIQSFQQYAPVQPSSSDTMIPSNQRERSISSMRGASSPSTTSSHSGPSSPSPMTSSSSFSAAEAPVVVATAVAEDSSYVKKVRHREIDRKRREREQRVMARLASLVNEFDQEFNTRPQEQAVAKRGKSKAKPLDRVALLEAACDRLEANKRELQLHYLLANARIRDMQVKLVSLAADTGHKIDTDSIYDSVPRLTGMQSMHWLLIQSELEAAYSRGETDPHFELKLPPSSRYTLDFRPSKNDPNFSQFMRSLYSLFRGETPSVQVSFSKPDADHNWVDTTTLIWIAPKPRFYGRADSDRSLTRGRIIVMAGRNYPAPPTTNPSQVSDTSSQSSASPDSCC